MIKFNLIMAIYHLYVALFRNTYQEDPLGPHVALCYKKGNQLLQGNHVASHRYVSGKEAFGLCMQHMPGRSWTRPEGNKEERRDYMM